jgi:hypothetical protein
MAQPFPWNPAKALAQALFDDASPGPLRDKRQRLKFDAREISGCQPSKRASGRRASGRLLLWRVLFKSPQFG